MMAFCICARLSKHRARLNEHTYFLAQSLLSTLTNHVKCPDVAVGLVTHNRASSRTVPVSSSKFRCHHKILKLTKLHYSQDTFRPTCWKCGETGVISSISSPSHFCKKCNALQKPDLKMNYFDVIGVEQKYEINVNEVTSKFRKLQNILHPDRFSNRDKEEIMISEDYSALLNKAYTTLLHPLRRGQYMLQLKGIHLEDGRVKSSPEFLMKMMEKNEEIDEAQDAAELLLLETQIKSSMDELSKKVAEALNSGDIKYAEETLIEMKYYASMGAKIKDLKQKRGIGN